MVSGGPPRVLIAGGGYVGVHTAMRLQKRLRAGEIEIVLVNPENFMLYQPLLPEVASGTLEPRHGVVPLRQTLRSTHLVSGRLEGLQPERRVADIAREDGRHIELEYDHVVIGVGSLLRVLPIPGLAENAVGFNSVAEAIYLRNRVLAQMEQAADESDLERRRRNLTFVFVGGGYSGVEALAELEDMARACLPYYSHLSREDMRWVLIEATDRILPVVEPKLSAYALTELRRRGIKVYLNTTLDSAEDCHLQLSNGEAFDAETLVWTAGIMPNPVVGELGLPTDDMGRLPVDEFLRVAGAENVWAAGDCAAVPDLVNEETCPPTAQHALRQGRQLGENVAKVIRGEQPEPFRYRALGQMVTLGERKAVAQVLGKPFSGFVPWFMRRGYYAWNIPTWNRSVRVLVDWTVGLAFRRDVVHLGSLHDPRSSFKRAVSRSG
ncbi:MAG: NAD(P)/FAD-dependent oxidoreductase [Egibacteraceae bacterium]